MNYLFCSFFSIIFGFILDIIFGDPKFSFHPICIIGNIISFLEKIFRKNFSKSEKSLILGGFIMVILTLMITVGTTIITIYIIYSINILFGLIFESILCYFIFAMKSLKKESMKVFIDLKNNDIESARKSVSMIVGRDTNVLDREGIIKATVETIAENTSDGVIAPMFYMIIGGAVLGVFYKTINTMDSMIGYKNDKYIYFGKAAAKLDDIVNFIPSRISAIAMIIASFVMSFYEKFDYKNAIKIFKRDRFKHASPNSAQTEAVCAGALRIKLAGDAWYFGKLYKKDFIGDNINPVNYDNIRQANILLYSSSFISMIIFLIFKALIIF